MVEGARLWSARSLSPETGEVACKRRSVHRCCCQGRRSLATARRETIAVASNHAPSHRRRTRGEFAAKPPSSHKRGVRRRPVLLPKLLLLAEREAGKMKTEAKQRQLNLEKKLN
nr:hypothetical protein Itr_chr03CG14870 [Ipomoea trifida]